MKKIVAISALVLLLASAVIVPLVLGQGSSQSYAIRRAKIYTLAGPPIENGTIVIRNGKIEAVGRNVAIPRGAKVIDAKGLEVYPGLFDSASQLGLIEIASVAGTVDTNEMGSYNPQLIAATAVRPDSEHIPVARANGITHALSTPGIAGQAGGATLSGQASTIHMSGWSIDEMLIRRSTVMVINWPSIRSGPSFDFLTGIVRRRPFTEVKQEYEKKVNELIDFLDKARHYAQAKEKGSVEKFERDLKLESLIPVIRGELPVMVMANDDRDIKNAIEFCDKQKLKMILGGGAQAWKVKSLLKEKNIPVILRPIQELPVQEDDPYDKPNSNPGELQAAGVKIAIATFSSSDSRTLPYEAGNAVPFGLAWEDALKAITINPAEILGISDRIGTLEPGKIANLIVTNGDPLEFRTEVKYLFINGQLTSTDNKHKQLYEKYSRRP
jgi:imidazolonepropionase-like amidohydrolase